MEIVEVTEVTEQFVAAVAYLIPQLDPTVVAPGRAHLEAVVSSPATTLLIAREGGPGEGILGMLTLARYTIPTGVRVWVEDVVVDGSARGRGVGEALLRAAIESARESGATRVDLTSRPEREAADRLYRRMGFQVRDTSVYRCRLTDAAG